jgi:predicted DsbA family dithiol-disulfide isomerase
MPELVRVYFDYVCPFAWRGAEIAELVAEELDLSFDWRHFSLYQSNHRGRDHWQLWNDKIDAEDDNGCKGLFPFLASCAARRQGDRKYDAFRLQLLRARHRNHCPLNGPTIFEAAETAGLHMPQFEDDLADPECRTALAQEHHRAAALDVFGTPTFHFSGDHLAYFRIRELPRSREEAFDLFSSYKRLLETYPYLETIKRPRRKGN